QTFLAKDSRRLTRGRLGTSSDGLTLLGCDPLIRVLIEIEPFSVGLYPPSTLVELPCRGLAPAVWTDRGVASHLLAAVRTLAINPLLLHYRSPAAVDKRNLVLSAH